MCGILGFNNILSKDNAQQILKNMSYKLQHRGPDSQGFYLDDTIGLGVRRLKIVDLFTGDQPIYSNDKNYVIVFNGEIYNYIEIREYLEKKGFIFKTRTDTEVVVNLFQYKGIDFLHDLNGMFGLALYDISNKELILARDRFGIKPLLYYYNNNNFIFASEIKSLLVHPNFIKKINTQSLDLYLTMESIPAPFSIYENLFKLEKGHYIKFSSSRIIKKKWYNLDYYPKYKNLSFNKAKEDIDGLIHEAVKLSTRSDVPYGSFLSGGVDSSTITSHLAKINKNDLKTFSIGFEDKTFDESKDSKVISNYLGTDHHEYILTHKEIINNIISIPSSLDEPFADVALIPNTILSKFAKDYVKVVITGDGGDEVFGGYPTYLARMIANFIPKFSHSTFKLLSSFMPTNFDYLSTDFKIKKFFRDIEKNPDLRHIYWLGSFNESEKLSLFTNDFKSQKSNLNNIKNLVERTISSSNLENNWERSLFLDMSYYLVNNNLFKSDITSMSQSLELRVPLLDYNVVEYAAKLPLHYKYRMFTSKYILRKISQNHVPKNISNLTKKGLDVPITKMINNEIKEIICDTLLSNKFYENGLFNKDYIINLLSEHHQKIKNNRREIWTLFVFGIWYNNNFG